VQSSALFAAGIGILLVGAAVIEPTLAQNATPTPDLVALTPSGETTVARRLLMNSIGANNDILHEIMDGVLPMDDLELRGRLQSISAMLYAFPNLYRVQANPYSEEGEQADAARVSLANAAVWEDFETFKLLSYEAYLKAQEGADAPPDQMLARIEELEAMCEGCHEVYRTPFEYFDFDRVEDFLVK
jgi:cytochrome c556